LRKSRKLPARPAKPDDTIAVEGVRLSDTTPRKGFFDRLKRPSAYDADGRLNVGFYFRGLYFATAAA
jgi:hypothetical protein